MCYVRSMTHLLRRALLMPRRALLGLIRVYQKTISPDHGWTKKVFPQGYCRYYPTCSEYGYQVIKKRGVLLGVPLALWRIVRCNPFSRGGVDLP